MSAHYGWNVPQEIFKSAKNAAIKSITLDPKLAEAHTSRALVALFLEWDWEQAEKEFETAIDLNPDYANAHLWYGDYFLTMEHYKDAIAQGNRAIALEPDVPIYQASAGMAYYADGQYDEAIKQFQGAVNAADFSIMAAQ